MSILDRIKDHADLVSLNEEDQVRLCQELRDFLISHISQTGGHLSSNLGVVELTVAIETVFDTNKDRLVFDVGHQSYVHKLLTGRQADLTVYVSWAELLDFRNPVRVTPMRSLQAMLPVLFRLHWEWQGPES